MVMFLLFSQLLLKVDPPEVLQRLPLETHVEREIVVQRVKELKSVSQRWVIITLSGVDLQLSVLAETPAADAPGFVNERQPLEKPELDIKAEVQAVIVSLVPNS